MIRRSFLTAFCVAALSLVGDRAEAAFTITASVNTPTFVAATGTAPTAAILGLTFMPANLTNGPTPTPTSGISYNFLNITYDGTSTFTGSGTITLTGTLGINNNNATGTSTFTEVLTYNFTNGTGTLSATAPGTIVPSVLAGVTFGPIAFAAPTILAGSSSTGNLSSVVTAAAVPEPASAVMLGLGLAGAGFVAAKRRRNG